MLALAHVAHASFAWRCPERLASIKQKVNRVDGNFKVVATNGVKS